ncbi:MAG: two-component sensor histidine kinase [Gammaproteobacteria bacterium]|nr:two-component sensor histidine kinase [Gammaproteobacteria bacterium]
MLSIRRFLLFYLLVSLTAILLIIAVLNFYISSRAMSHDFDMQLAQTTNLLATALDHPLNNKEIDALQQEFNNQRLFCFDIHSKTHHGKHLLDSQQDEYQFIAWDKSNHLILHSPGAPAIALPKKEGFSTLDNQHQGWRLYTTHDRISGLTITTAEALSTRQQINRTIDWETITILLLGYPILGLLIWLIVGYALRSVKLLTRMVSKRAATEFDPIDTHNIPIEIRPLVEALSNLFERLHEAFERNQRFAADAAHELKTPLAALKTQLQVALHASNEEARQKNLEKVVIGTDRCSHIVQQLLDLSRYGPEALALEKRCVDLTIPVQEVTAQLAPIALKKSIDIALQTSESDNDVYGNETALAILIRNLVDNAIRYTPNHGKIIVSVTTQDGQVILSIQDSGPGIALNIRDRIFERFYRVLGSKTTGSGLGLAIVKQIAELHKAEIELDIPLNGNGLIIRAIFPNIVEQDSPS